MDTHQLKWVSLIAGLEYGMGWWNGKRVRGAWLIMLGRNFSPSSQLTRLQYATHGTWSKIFTSRRGRIWSPNSGVALISWSPVKEIGECAWIYECKERQNVTPSSDALCNFEAEDNYCTPAPAADNRRYDESRLAHAKVGRSETGEAKTAFIEQVLEKARERLVSWQNFLREAFALYWEFLLDLLS